MEIRRKLGMMTISWRPAPISKKRKRKTKGKGKPEK